MTIKSKFNIGFLTGLSFFIIGQIIFGVKYGTLSGTWTIVPAGLWCAFDAVGMVMMLISGICLYYLNEK